MNWIYYDNVWVNLATACLIEAIGDNGRNGYRIFFPGDEDPVSLDLLEGSVRHSEEKRMAIEAIRSYLTASRVSRSNV